MGFNVRFRADSNFCRSQKQAQVECLGFWGLGFRGLGAWGFGVPGLGFPTTTKLRNSPAQAAVRLQAEMLQPVEFNV